MAKYQINDACIGCGMCVAVAADYFKMDDDKGVAVVIAQPESDEEIALCDEALASCPVDAIGRTS